MLERTPKGSALRHKEGKRNSATRHVLPKCFRDHDLLPSETLEPGFSQKISIETARKWMIELGFSVVRKKKGKYVDGHEREHVIDYHKTFLRKMVSIGFLNESCAPTEEVKKKKLFRAPFKARPQKWPRRQSSCFRGIDTRGMKADDMRLVLGNHPDFKGEKSSVERFLMEERGHIVYMLPKFHCEVNPIECRGQL